MARGADAEAGVAIEAGVLARAMKHAAAIVESRNTIPIFANVLLRAEGETLEIVTTDLDVEFRQRLPLTQPGEFATTVDAKRLVLLASAVGEKAPLSLRIEDNGRLTVQSGRSRWQLPALPAQDFPNMPFESAPSAAGHGGELASAVARVAPSVFVGDARPMLAGMCLNPENGKLRLTSTDAHRGMYVDTSIDWPEGAPQIIAPAKLMNAIRGVCDGAEVRLAWDDRKLRAEVGTIVIVGKTIDQTYPEYRRAWPEDSAEPVRVDPAALRAAIRRVSLVAAEKTRLIKCQRGDGLIELSVTSIEGGAACEQVSAESTPGPAVEFNVTFLESTLEAIGGETIEIHHFAAAAGATAKFRRVPPDGAVGVVKAIGV